MFTEREQKFQTSTNNQGLNRSATMLSALTSDIHEITPELNVIKDMPKINDYWMRHDMDHCLFVYDPNIIEAGSNANNGGGVIAATDDVAEETNKNKAGPNVN